MNEWMDDWLTASVTLAVGLAAGWWALSRARQKGEATFASGPDLEELEARKGSLIVQLRELTEQRDRIPTASFDEQRGKLESAAAGVLREIDGVRKKSSGKAGKDKPAAEKGNRSAILVLRVVVALAVLFWFIYPAFEGGAPQAPQAAAPARTPSAPAADPVSDAHAAELAVLMKRIHENPDDVEALVAGGNIFLQTNRLDQAAWLLEQARSKAPEDPKVLVPYAGLKAARGETATARQIIDGVVERNPEYHEAWYLRGMVAMHGGDNVAARESFSQYVARAPDGPKKERLLGIAGMQDAPPEVAAAEGARITWQKKCAGCHGGAGAGDGPMGRVLGIGDLTDGAWQGAKSDDDIRAGIRGQALKEIDGQKRPMHESAGLTEEQVAALAELIRSWRPGPQ